MKPLEGGGQGGTMVMFFGLLNCVLCVVCCVLCVVCCVLCLWRKAVGVGSPPVI